MQRHNLWMLQFLHHSHFGVDIMLFALAFRFVDDFQCEIVCVRFSFDFQYDRKITIANHWTQCVLGLNDFGQSKRIHITFGWHIYQIFVLFIGDVVQIDGIFNWHLRLWSTAYRTIAQRFSRLLNSLQFVHVQFEIVAIDAFCAVRKKYIFFTEKIAQRRHRRST